MLSEKEKVKLEKLQSTAVKLIFGNKKSYKKLREEFNLDTLETRRKNAVKKFAIKNEKNPRFGPKWFKPNTTNVNTRNKEK